MARNIFRGLGIALVTPFTSNGQVDYKSLKRLVEYQIDNGADFLCILATTGETPCLTQDEKDKITQLVKDVNHGRLPILKGCGGNNTAAVVEELRTADWSGIDGILTSGLTLPFSLWLLSFDNIIITLFAAYVNTIFSV